MKGFGIELGIEIFKNGSRNDNYREKDIPGDILFCSCKKRRQGKILWYVRLCMACNGTMGRAIATLAKVDAEVGYCGREWLHIRKLQNGYAVFDRYRKV